METITLTKQTAQMMQHAVALSGKTPNTIVKQSLAHYLEELEDYAAVMARKSEKRIPWGQVKAECGL